MGGEWLDEWEKRKEAWWEWLDRMEEFYATEEADQDLDEDTAVDEDRLRRYDERG